MKFGLTRTEIAKEYATKGKDSVVEFRAPEGVEDPLTDLLRAGAKRVEAALPWLYLKGVATGQMQEALEVLVGPEARGLSASVISRLKR